MKNLLTLLLLWSSFAAAQSSNVRAQGRYYSAKEAYETGDCSRAAVLAKEAETLLGGTNQRLVYLEVVALFCVERFADARVALSRYFDLVDKKIDAVQFLDGVDALSETEKKNLTRLIDKIEAGADQQDAAKKERVAASERRDKMKQAAKADPVGTFKKVLARATRYRTRLCRRIACGNSDRLRMYCQTAEIDAQSVALQAEGNCGLKMIIPGRRFDVCRDGEMELFFGEYNYAMLSLYSLGDASRGSKMFSFSDGNSESTMTFASDDDLELFGFVLDEWRVNGGCL